MRDSVSRTCPESGRANVLSARRSGVIRDWRRRRKHVAASKRSDAAAPPTVPICGQRRSPANRETLGELQSVHELLQFGDQTNAGMAPGGRKGVPH